MLNDLPPWPNSNTDNKDTTYEDWVDKVMVNKLEVRDNDSLGDWPGEARHLPEFFYQKYLPDMRVFPEQQCNGSISRTESQEFDLQRTRSESATTDDSDEFDIATIDSSDTDMLWQFSNRSFAAANGNMSRIKKPQTRPPGSPEIRYHLLQENVTLCIY